MSHFKTQAAPAPIVVKLKKFDDHHAGVVLPRASHLSIETLEDETLSSSTLRIKLKNSFVNGDVDQNGEACANLISAEDTNHLVKPSRKSSSGNSPPSNIIPSIVEADAKRQISVKLRKPDNDPLISDFNGKTSPMSTEYLINEQQNCSTANGHNEPLYKPLTIQSSTAPAITNMLSNLNHSSDPTTTTAITTTSASSSAETHTKELLDEALDSVKNVLMQTFKKNLESGGDLNALKSTLGSDEVAEVFLAKLRQSLKRDSENELKSQESYTDADIHSSPTSIPSSSSNVMISPVMNVVSSPSSSPLLPPMSTMINRTTSPSIAIPSSPQSQATISNNNNNSNKRKSSTPSTNPNRFDGATEEELAQRVLSDILQPNLDIVFVGINPSLYAVHKGHHYGGPGNHFWKLLHMSGLIPSAFNASDDYRMPQYGIGFTNIVQRPSKAGSDITKDEITAGAEILMKKIKIYRPKIVAFNGRGIYEVYAGNKHFHYGKQPELFLGTDTHVFVMPSSSARCSQLPRAEDKLPFYVGLRKLRDFVNGTLQTLNEAEITFPDIKIKDTDDALQKTIIRISNKPFSELSAETLKSFGDKIPSGQMISKHIPSSQQIICSSPSPSSPSSSSSNLVFNTDALTTQTMSILHNTPPQQNGNLLTHDQQAQRVYLQSNGNYSPSPPPPPLPSSVNQQQRPGTNGTTGLSKSSFLDNSSSNTNAAVLAALASGAYNAPSTQSPQTYYQQPQTVYIGGQQQQQYSVTSSLNNNSTNKSYVIHHPPQSTTATDHQTSSLSQVLSRPLTVVNSLEPLPSFSTILSSTSSLLQTPQNLPKDSLSSHSSTGKQTLIVMPPKTKPISSSPHPSTVILSKPSNTNTTGKRPLQTADDCSYVRYEREPSAINADPFRFSYVIDEHSPSFSKRLRYVSINDL